MLLLLEEERLVGVFDSLLPSSVVDCWQASGSAAASAVATDSNSGPRERRYS